MSITFSKTRWEVERLGPMTEPAIRHLQDGHGQARISRYVYAAGDETEGQSKKCKGYVLDGSLVFASVEGASVVEAGEMFTFCGGAYTIKASESSGAVVIWVWELPPGLGSAS